MPFAIFKGLFDSCPHKLLSLGHNIFTQEVSIPGDRDIPTFWVMRDSLRRVRNGRDRISTRVVNPVWTTSIEISLESDDNKQSNQSWNLSRKREIDIQIHQMSANHLLMHLPKEKNKTNQQSFMMDDH